MPIYVGNSTVNTSIAGSNVTVNVPQGYAEYNATRNSIMPTLRLDFVNSNVLDPRITFTRASSATYFNSAGALTTAANNIPRFDYNPSTLACNGLLIEAAATNSLLYSQSLQTSGSWPTLTATVTGNAVVAPDGTTTAAGVALTGNAGYVGQTAALAGSVTVTFSAFVKPNSSNWIELIPADFGGSGVYVWFDMSTCTTGANLPYGSVPPTFVSSTAQALPNGWCRVSVTVTSNAGATGNLGVLFMPTASNSVQGVTGNSAYVWGVQRELGSVLTSYIVTTSASATRAVDQTSLTGTNFSSWYNATNWTTTVYAIPANIPNTSGSTELLFQFTLDASNRILARIGTSSSVITSYWINNISQPQNAGGYNSSSLTANTLFKYGMTASNGSWNLALNGTIYNSSAGYLITPTSFSIGYSSEDYNGFNGWIQRVAYYPVVVSNNELISLTS